MQNYINIKRYGSTTYLITILAIIAIVALLVLTSSCRSTESSQTVPVEINDMLKYTPDMITINVGDTIEWINNSLLVHTVTADPKLAAKLDNVNLPKEAKPFDSGDIAPGGIYEHKFNVQGHYRYFCKPHEGTGMIGDVIVK